MDTRELRGEIAHLEHVLDGKKLLLKKLEQDCRHNWTPAENADIYHAGYTIPADGAGSDWRPECHVPSSTDRRWKRTCLTCGKVKFTMNVNETVTKTPRF